MKTEELTETLTRAPDPRAHSPAASLHTDARSRALMKARAERRSVLTPARTRQSIQINVFHSKIIFPAFGLGGEIL